MQARKADANDADRRQFLLGLGKWSTVVIAAVAGGALLHGSAEGGWLKSRAGWINGGGGGWVNGRGGGGWLNAR